MLDVTNTQAYSKSTQVYSTPTIQTLNNKQLQWFHSVPFEWMLFTLVCFLLLMLTFLFFFIYVGSQLHYKRYCIAQVRHYEMDQSAWMFQTLDYIIPLLLQYSNSSDIKSNLAFLRLDCDGLMFLKSYQTKSYSLIKWFRQFNAIVFHIFCPNSLWIPQILNKYKKSDCPNIWWIRIVFFCLSYQFTLTLNWY